MQFSEMGRDDGKTLVLLPGTACTRQVNFARVIDALAERVADWTPTSSASTTTASRATRPSALPVWTRFCAKIEDYLIERHGGHVDGVYGSSLGGTSADGCGAPVGRR